MLVVSSCMKSDNIHMHTYRTFIDVIINIYLDKIRILQRYHKNRYNVIYMYIIIIYIYNIYNLIRIINHITMMNALKNLFFDFGLHFTCFDERVLHIEY